MIRKTLATTAAAALTVVGLGAPAWSAEEPEPIVITDTILNSPDNDPGGCGTWARDTFTRTFTLTPAGDDVFDVRIDIEGTFEDIESGITGTLTGVLDGYEIEGTLEENIEEVKSGYDNDWSRFDCKGERDGVDTPARWPELYFAEVDESTPFDSWEYTYATECETFTESSNEDLHDGSLGIDLTFIPCAVPEAPEFRQGTCEVLPLVTIPEVEGVVYEDANGHVLEGEGRTFNLLGGEDATVRATPAEGYVFPDEVATEWSFKANIMICDDEVVLYAPDFTQATCAEPGIVTIPEVEVLEYKDGGSGEELPDGRKLELADGEELTVVAAPAEDYVVLRDDPAVEWTFEAEAGDCATDDDNGKPDDEKDKSEETSRSNESTPAPTSGEELATTGSSGIGTTVGLAALLLMVGATLVFWARPRVLRGRNRA